MRAWSKSKLNCNEGKYGQDDDCAVAEVDLRQLPLVWKTRNSFRNVTVKTYIRLRKRWGNSGPFDWFAAN